MPELPEVETVVRGLRLKITGCKVLGVEDYRAGTVVWQDDQYDGSLGKIQDLQRRGKYIIFLLDSGKKIVVHLRMTGKLTIAFANEIMHKHDRARILLDNDLAVVFNDIRTFGKLEIYPKNVIPKFMEKLGAEPLSKKFDEKYLSGIVKNRKAPIKNILLNQGYIAGLGNIYAAEILFRAGVSPLRSGESLKKVEIKKIVEETKEVLSEAIELGGTTISDFRNSEDGLGSYQHNLLVYGRKQCSCGEVISKIKQAGRSTYYCKKCQK